MDQFGAHAQDLLVVLIGAPVGLAIAQRPQRGVLLLVGVGSVLGPRQGAPDPIGLEGSARAVHGRLDGDEHRRQAAAGTRVYRRSCSRSSGTSAIACASALLIRGAQAEIGLKIGFFWALMAVMVWLRPLDGRDRDLVVTIMMVNAVITAIVGIGQQVVGAGRLVELGYDYNTTVRFTGHFLRSFSTFRLPFDFGFYLALVIVIGTSVSLREPRRVRSVLFFCSLADHHRRPALLVRARRVSRRR